MPRITRHHGKLGLRREACFSGLLTRPRCFRSRRRLLGARSNTTKQTTQFRIAYKEATELRQPFGSSGAVYILERFKPGDAANLFQEALKIDPNYAPAYLGLARVAAEGYDKKAVDFAHEALRARSETGRSSRTVGLSCARGQQSEVSRGRGAKGACAFSPRRWTAWRSSLPSIG